MTLGLRRIDPTWYALIAIVALGLFLRAHGLNWDQGIYLHPDERFIALVSSERVDLPGWDNLDDLLDPAHSPMNPRRDDVNGVPLSFAYGSLPLYVQNAVSWSVGLVSDTDFQAYPNVYRVGRALNVLLDSLTIVLAFLITRRLFDRRAALVAASLYALAVLPIQLSHFFTVDIWLTFFVTLTLYLALRYLDAPTTGRAVALGLPVGAAFATKASVPSLTVPLAIMAAWAVWRSNARRRVVGRVALSGIIAAVVFSVFEPYAIIRMTPFIQDIRLQADIVRGTFDVPFTRQFVGLTPGLYELRNLFAYGLGPAFLLASLAGVVFGIRRFAIRRDPKLLILLGWVFAYIPTLLITEARFLRYSLPLIPIFAVLAAGVLTRASVPARPRLRHVLVALVLIVTATWAIGFSTIYTEENPRIAASRWMNENIPAGSVITAEYWDDAMPVPYPGSPPLAYSQVPFDVYADLPPEDKAIYIAQTLQSADYVVLSSDRIIDSVDNLPWRYAVQNEYYRRLLDGQLGFQLVYEASLRPELFGVRFDDSGSDESFTVYDHPHVRIFKKVEDLSTTEVRERLLWGIQQEWIPQRYPPEQTLLLDRPVGEIEVTNDAGWNGPAGDHTIIAIVIWLVAIEVIGLAILPAASYVLARTPDRGMLSSRLLGLLVLGWLAWIGASLNAWPFRSLTIAILLGIVAIASWSWWIWRKQGAEPVVLPGRRLYMLSLGVWLGIFGFFLLLRAIYPDFWQTWFGGEKPFELAYLRAVSSSVSFPPYDPWYADGIINYYYYGWHLLATVIKLTGIGVSTGFQVGLATFAALLGLQVASLGATLARRRSAITRNTVLAGILTVVAVLFVGNLDGVVQVLGKGAVTTDTFDFWHSTRVIDYTINEFPYFSQIWADVHPHVLNFPAVALLLTLLASTVATGPWTGLLRQAPLAAVSALVLGGAIVTNAWDAPLYAGLTVAAFTYVGALRSMRYAVVGFMLGVLTVGASLVLFLPFHSGFYSVVQGVGLTSAGSDLGQFLTVWGIFFGIFSIAVVAEIFRRSAASRDLHAGLTFAGLVAVAGVGAGVAGFALGVGTVTAAALISLAISSLLIGAAGVTARPLRESMLFVMPLALACVITGAIVVYRPAAAVGLAVAIAAAMQSIRFWLRPVRALPWALVAVAAVTIAAVEIVYIADDLQNSDWERMNTVFKFYLQAWILLAVGTAVLLARLWRGSLLSNGISHGQLGIVARPLSAPRALPAIATADRVAAVLGTTLLLTGIVYPLLGTPARLSWDMPSSPNGLTLDGYAWMSGGQILNGTGQTIDFTGDLAAIRWLDEHARGNDVILEAAIGPYRGNGSRISSATGLPTVLGWDRHQRQQRYWPGIDQRVTDVRAIYNEVDPDRKLEMVRRYRVRYVVVGDVERFWNTQENPTPYASPAGLAAFETMIGDGLEVVFESGGTRIYQVSDFPRMPPAASVQRQP